MLDGATGGAGRETAQRLRGEKREPTQHRKLSLEPPTRGDKRQRSQRIIESIGENCLVFISSAPIKRPIKEKGGGGVGGGGWLNKTNPPGCATTLCKSLSPPDSQACSGPSSWEAQLASLHFPHLPRRLTCSKSLSILHLRPLSDRALLASTVSFPVHVSLFRRVAASSANLQAPAPAAGAGGPGTSADDVHLEALSPP